MIGLNKKFYSIILFSLLGVSAVLFLLFMSEVIGESLLLNWCFLLFGIAALVSVVFPVITMASDLKKAKGSLIGFALLVVFFVIGYMLSTEEIYTIGDNVVEGMTSRRSEAGLITFYIMIIVAIAAILYTEISKAFK